MNGWYKQNRNILERTWFKDAEMVQLYNYLKAMAYVTDGKYQGQIIRRGSCPTTRAEMSETTGMSLRTLDRVLRRLVDFGEIIVNGNNHFTMVTVCDYDACDNNEILFGTADGIADGTTTGIADGTAVGTTPNISNKNKEERIDNLISPFSPYKKERERGDVALEIKKRYNRVFDGTLPPCLRLSTATRMQVYECIRRFGLQSVDLVFNQIASEKFSLGNNKTGFIANFTFIFSPKNYQQYLERAQLAKKKGSLKTVASAPEQTDAAPQETLEEMRQRKDDERRTTLMGLVRMAKAEPDYKSKVWSGCLLAAYNSGELSSLNIDWKP